MTALLLLGAQRLFGSEEYLIKRNGYEKNPEISNFFVYLSKEYSAW